MRIAREAGTAGAEVVPRSPPCNIRRRGTRFKFLTDGQVEPSDNKDSDHYEGQEDRQESHFLFSLETGGSLDNLHVSLDLADIAILGKPPLCTVGQYLHSGFDVIT